MLRYAHAFFNQTRIGASAHLHKVNNAASAGCMMTRDRMPSAIFWLTMNSFAFARCAAKDADRCDGAVTEAALILINRAGTSD